MIFRKYFDFRSVIKAAHITNQQRLLFAAGVALLFCGQVNFAADEVSVETSEPKEVAAVEATAEATADSTVEATAENIEDTSADGSDTQSMDGSLAEEKPAAIEVEEATPKEALVAVRGTSKGGLGVIVTIDGHAVVLTSLSALDGSRRIVVNTADGFVVPIIGIIGAVDRDLAVLKIDPRVIASPDFDLPIAGVVVDPEIQVKDSVKLTGAMSSFLMQVKTIQGPRYLLDEPDEPVLVGSPISIEGDVVGIFSPLRSLFGALGSNDKKTLIWEPALVPFTTETSWEKIDLQIMAAERNSLNAMKSVILELGSFLGVGGSKSEVTMQRLISAQNRLADKLVSSNERERDRGRGSFIFSLKSAAGSLETDLLSAESTYYNFYVPEIIILMEMYRPIREKINSLEKNPGSVDSYGRK